MKNPSPVLPRSPKLPPAEWVVRAGAVQDVLGEMDRILAAQRRRRKTRLKAAAVAAACLAVGFWLVPLLRDTGTVETLAARQQTVALADGSLAELNAQTSLRTDFRYGRRVVRLDKGEAFFSVAKDARHPFYVATSAGTVRVTGTKFNVRVAARDQIEVTLLEGAVTVEPVSAGAEPVRLAPGQLLELVAGQSALRAPSAAELEHRLAWRQGRVVFDGDTLADAAARFAEFHGLTITVDPKAATLRLGGSYPLADLKEFTSALEATLPVRVLRGEQSYRIVAK